MALRETNVEVNILGNVEPLKRINEMMDNVMKTADKMGAILDKAMGGVKTSSNGASSAINEVQKAANTAKSNISGLGNTATEARTKMDHMSHSMHGMGNEAASLSERLHQNMGDLMMASASLTAAGYGVAKAVGYTVKSAADFNQEMANTKSVMNPAEVNKYSGALQNLAIQQGIKTKYSAVEAAQAEGELAKAGVSVHQIMHGALAGSLNLATAGELNLKDAAEIASTALNTFHDRGMTVSKAADILAGAANASATDVGELKYSLSMSATVAAGLGATLKGTSTTLAVFAQNGLKGSDAGTSLKTMMSRLHPMTKDQWAMFEQLGLTTVDASKAMQVLRDHGVKPLSNDSGTLMRQMEQLAAKITNSKVGSTKATKEFTALANGTGAVHSAFFKANGQVKSFSSIAQLLKTHLNSLNGEQRQAALYTMFGSDAIRGANILYKEGAKGVDSMAKSMSKIKAADVAKQKMDTFKGSVEQLRGNLETMGIVYGNLILPAFGKFVGLLTNVVNFMTRLPAPLKIAVIVLTSMAAAILLASGAAIGLTMTLGALSMATSAFGISLAALVWPITLVVAAIAALAAAAYLIVKNWWPIKGFFSNLWSGTVSVTKNALHGISSTAVSAYNGARSGISSAMRGIASLSSTVWHGISSTAIAIVKPFITAVMTVFKAMSPGLTSIMNGIKTIMRGLWLGIKTVILGPVLLILDLVTGDFQHLRSDAIGIFNNLRKSLGMIWSGIKGVIGGYVSAIYGGAKAGFNLMKNTVLNIVKGIRTGVSAIWNGIKNFIFNIIPKIGSNVASGFRTMKSSVGSLMGDIWKAVTNKFNDIVDGAKSLPGKIGNGIKNMAVHAVDGIKDMANALVKKFRSILGIHSPSTVFTKMGGHIVQGLINGLSVGNLKSLGMSVLKDFGGGVVQGWNNVKSFFSGMLGGGSGGSKSVTGWLTAALGATGTPLSWLQPLTTIAMKESGGNPNAVNRWDSNAKAGHPSMGLMQTIGSTFNAYKLPNLGGILNPVANAAASIRYIKSRYGSVFNVPGIKSMASGGGYKGYASGGEVRTPQIAALAEHRYPEFVISTEPAMRRRSLGLFNRLGQALGVIQSPGTANAQAQTSAYTPETSQTTTYNRSSRSMEYHPEIHVTVKGDGSTTGNVKKAVKEALDDHYKEMAGLYDPGVAY
ncbi:phage tail tape measure protein [Sporolactobacillus shoreicorticis]|uniref:Phage tail tape measure protein n=1 Tax=Sporolactobacillus shoreicorticis TaxID=1923877 RepID=A0ABW5S5C6_9BACL|nr:phage tail tape measure protein [Sporolactobacillus shoreicorticis]MCO7127819.1 phage tail tape measure protein [Sporolactobacillus shoreicorticis]